jgi:hypothetical protein
METSGNRCKQVERGVKTWGKSVGKVGQKCEQV